MNDTKYAAPMGFPEALNYLLQGRTLTRLAWEKMGAVIFVVPGSQFEVNRAPLNTMRPEGTKVNYHSHIDMIIGDFVTPWTPQYMDMFATDWVLAEVSIQEKRGKDGAKGLKLIDPKTLAK